ncbi:MAG: hypothetical protein JXD23_13260 [Spirochaetales bacterium]|nr:hypothetical protein [Spirochaetales bacterium]
MKNKKTAVLFSAGTFGTYIPALLLHRRLAKKGVPTDLYMLEDVYYPQKREELIKAKRKYRENFRFALAAQSLTRDISGNFDPRRVADLYGEWERKGLRKFIAFSGFWIPLLRGFAEREKAGDVEADLCHMDSVPSTSFKPYRAEDKAFRHRWFFERPGNRVHSFIGTGDGRPLPFSEREERFVVHGGGGGLGTYRDKLSELDRAGLSLDVVFGDGEEADALTPVLRSGHRYFFQDPSWNPLIHGMTPDRLFPPLREKLRERGEDREWRHDEYHILHRFISRARAVISKPGGMTLMDSLRTATPLVLLEPYGDYEKKNAELWRDLGFGVPYRAWLDGNGPLSALQTLHGNLLSARKNIKDFADIIAGEITHAG